DYKVSLVSSGLEAVSEVDESYDLVVLDWKMPGIDGLETWIRIKEKLGKNVPKAIMVTSYQKSEITDQATQEGFEKILSKPITQSMLFDAILDLFGEEITRNNTTHEQDVISGLDEVRGARILVAEDNQINQQVVREILENEGFWVDIAENGQIAVEMVMEKSFDVVLMDLQMPVLDGYQATKIIRSKNQSDLPIIALSADAMEGTRSRVEEAGMSDYITKPIILKDLFEVLVKWITPGTRDIYDGRNEPSDESLRLSLNLKSFDVEAALLRIGGNQNLYVDILKKFAANYGNFTREINELLLSGDIPTVERHMHTLKGVAGNIGAKDLQYIVQVLEAKFKSGEDILKLEAMKVLEEKLTISIQEIACLNAREEEPVEINLSVEELLQNLEDLKVLIDDYDIRAEEKMKEVKATLTNMGYSNQTKDMEYAIKNYDIDQACTICTLLINELHDRR
ncbi:MAG: response regulator, partial [Chitinophagales bacterium]